MESGQSAGVQPDYVGERKVLSTTLQPDMKTHPTWDVFSCLAEFIPPQHHERAHLGTFVTHGTRFHVWLNLFHQNTMNMPIWAHSWCSADSPPLPLGTYGARFMSAYPPPLPKLPMCLLGHIDVPFEHQSPLSGRAMVFEGWDNPNNRNTPFWAPLLFCQ